VSHIYLAVQNRSTIESRSVWFVDYHSSWFAPIPVLLNEIHSARFQTEQSCVEASGSLRSSPTQCMYQISY